MQRRLELQPRLQAIADWVRPGARIADVGTDHGYLPVWLLQTGVVEYAIASDINESPLEHARRTSREYGQQILDALLCLLVGIVGNKGAGRRIQRELTGNEHKAVCLDSLRIRADSAGSSGRRDHSFHRKNPPCLLYIYHSISVKVRQVLIFLEKRQRLYILLSDSPKSF